MHISCPSCQTVFAIGRDQLHPSEARQLRCSVCNHVWHATRQSAVEVYADSKPQSKNASIIAAMPFRAEVWQWLAMAVVLVALGLGAVLGRSPITAIFPQTLTIYEAMGFSITPQVAVIEFEALTHTRRGASVFVRGFVVNTGIWPVHAPPIAITLHDARRAVLVSREIVLEKPIIAAGERVPINAQLVLTAVLPADVETSIVPIAVPRLPGRAQAAAE